MRTRAAISSEQSASRAWFAYQTRLTHAPESLHKARLDAKVAKVPAVSALQLKSTSRLGSTAASAVTLLRLSWSSSRPMPSALPDHANVLDKPYAKPRCGVCCHDGNVGNVAHWHMRLMFKARMTNSSPLRPAGGPLLNGNHQTQSIKQHRAWTP
ncbi:hypothetical protein J1614_001306 [Plenodomus biglobosus]|nr:hypothetical protein J1614_001306 [Plenodomus biglobosus]